MKNLTEAARTGKMPSLRISAWQEAGGTGRFELRRRPYVRGTAHKFNG
jgi:hypothetical protein